MSTRRRLWLGAALLMWLIAGSDAALAQQKLSVSLEDLTPAGYLPVSAAFCMPKGSGLAPGDRSPGVDWSAGPAGTQSYVVIMTDPDVPANLALMNKPGVVIPVGAPRMNIYHWVLIDIPAGVQRLAPGDDSDGFIPGGKPLGPSKIGVRGANDYWPLFNKSPGASPAMKGPYGGYDGPCPPNNDERVHDYRFQVFALDIAQLPLSGQFFAPAVLAAIRGHVLAQGEADAKFTFEGK